MQKQWYVYILRCADGSLYTGITNDPKRRLAQHNRGTAAKYTRSRRPVEMVHLCSVSDKGEALSQEAAIKRMSRSKKLEYLSFPGDNRDEKEPSC